MSRFENEGEGWWYSELWIFFRILYFNNDMENMQNVILNHVFFNFVIVIKDRNAAYVTVQNNAATQQN